MNGIITSRSRLSAKPQAALLLILLLALGCRQKMADQPSYRPLESSGFFDDRQASRPLVPDTVARGHLRADPHHHAGKQGDNYVDTFPSEVSLQTLERGQVRFNVFCAVCHDRLGSGNGKIVQRGFTRPPNFHTDLSRGFKFRGKDVPLREVPVGYIYSVITNGFGAMPDYAEQIPTDDRWAITAYVRTLQLSQRVPLDELPPEEQQKVRAANGGQR